MEPTPPPPPPPPPFIPVTPPPPVAQPAWWKRKRWKLPTWAWMILIALVVIGAAAGGGKKNDSAKPRTTSPAVATDAPSSETTTEPPVTAETAPEPTTTTEQTTTTTQIEGTRDAPWKVGELLSYGDYFPFTVSPIELVSNDTIIAANQFNEPAADGQTYARALVTAVYNGTGTGSYFDFFGMGLVGDNGKIYTSAPVSSSTADLQSLTDAPDVIAGGKLTGYLYFIVDANDGNLLATFDTPDGRRFVDVSP